MSASLSQSWIADSRHRRGRRTGDLRENEQGRGGVNGTNGRATTARERRSFTSSGNGHGGVSAHDVVALAGFIPRSRWCDEWWRPSVREASWSSSSVAAMWSWMPNAKTSAVGVAITTSTSADTIAPVTRRRQPSDITSGNLPRRHAPRDGSTQAGERARIAAASERRTVRVDDRHCQAR